MSASFYRAHDAFMNNLPNLQNQTSNRSSREPRHFP